MVAMYFTSSATSHCPESNVSACTCCCCEVAHTLAKGESVCSFNVWEAALAKPCVPLHFIGAGCCQHFIAIAISFAIAACIARLMTSGPHKVVLSLSPNINKMVSSSDGGWCEVTEAACGIHWRRSGDEPHEDQAQSELECSQAGQ